MAKSSLVLPLAMSNEPVRYVVIDDEPRYRHPVQTATHDLKHVGAYGTVVKFLSLQRKPCHVVVLDLCLNRNTGDEAVLQGVQAILHLTKSLEHRVIVFTADERPEPVARCVAAGAACFIDKYSEDDVLANAIHEVGTHGQIITDSLHEAFRRLVPRCRDVRLSETLEKTLTLLESGMTDLEVAAALHVSPRTIEDHKRKILQQFGDSLEHPYRGFGHLARELGIKPGDVVNDSPSFRPKRGAIAKAIPWLKRQAVSGD